jgi:hypothetical protein
MVAIQDSMVDFSLAPMLAKPFTCTCSNLPSMGLLSPDFYPEVFKICIILRVIDNLKDVDYIMLSW